MSSDLPDRLGRTHEVEGDQVVYHFANGLTIRTEVFHKNDPLRILPLGTPQGSLMNHLLGFPERVAGRRVFEPFAGSGALGFMALAAGAEHVDFLDVNPRAAGFQRENARLNRLACDRFGAITADVRDFAPPHRYDLILANPPFVPTPDGIDGTLTSNGGVDGSRLVAILLERLEDFLAPDGRALICVFQLEEQRRPLILEALASLARRPVVLTPSQAEPIPFEVYLEAYHRVFPDRTAAIERWRADLTRRHGDGLTLCHYVIDVGPRSQDPTECVIRDDFDEKFGPDFRVPSDDPAALAVGRVLENLVRAST